MKINNKYFEVLKQGKSVYIGKEDKNFMKELKEQCTKKDMSLKISIVDNFYKITLDNKKRYIVQESVFCEITRTWKWVNRKYYNCKDNAKLFLSKFSNGGIQMRLKDRYELL